MKEPHLILGVDLGRGASFAVIRCEHPGANGVAVLTVDGPPAPRDAPDYLYLTPEPSLWRLPRRYSAKAERRRARMARKRRRGWA